MKTTSKTNRFLSFVLAVLLIFYILPISAIANADFGSEDAEESAPLESESTLTSENEAFEVVSLRESNVKHFKTADGTYVAAAYSSPVHYLKDGVWEDIDNRLVENASEFSTNNSRVKFSKKISGNGEIFTLHENNAKITLSLVGAIKKTEGVVVDKENGDDTEKTELGKLMNLENLTSGIIYKDILDGTDVEYVLDGLNIKENIIVKEKKDNYLIRFLLL